MLLPEDVWKIIKSYLMDSNTIQRRLFIKQMNNRYEDMKWRKIFLLNRICVYEKSETEEESEED